MDFLKQPICWNEPSDLSGARGRMKWCHRPTICGLGRALAPSSKFARESPYPIQRLTAIVSIHARHLILVGTLVGTIRTPALVLTSLQVVLQLWNPFVSFSG